MIFGTIRNMLSNPIHFERLEHWLTIFFSFFFTYISIAKDRLSVMLVHQRNNDVIQNIDMDALQAEVAGVIAKYVNIARNANAKVG